MIGLFKRRRAAKVLKKREQQEKMSRELHEAHCVQLDAFAAAALSALPPPSTRDVTAHCKRAFDIAEAMLAERSRR